jgi:hypothetical protein
MVPSKVRNPDHRRDRSSRHANGVERTIIFVVRRRPLIPDRRPVPINHYANGVSSISPRLP